MGERRSHSEPVRVTVGKVTAETRYSGALVWVGGAGGNSVRFAWPDDATDLISHELDVQEVA